MPDQPSDITADRLSAEVMAVRWSADDFAVLAAVTDDGDEVTLTGPLGHVRVHDHLEVSGRFRQHARHGWQFHVTGVRVQEPVSEQALTGVLLGVRHIGLRGAKWLLTRHGADVLRNVDADPEARLAEVPGIGKAKLRAAVASWQEQRGQRAVRLFLEEHGVDAAAAARIVKAFGAGTVELLRGDPYAITQLDGVGFATADALARALGTPADSPGRLQAGVVHALQQAEDDGHCHLPRPELDRRAAALLGAPVGEAIDDLAAQGRVVRDGELVVEARMDAIERRLAGKVRELLDAEPSLGVEVPDAPPAELDPAPTPAQWGGVRRACEHRLSILTGLPGTGKTATMRALVDLAVGARKRVRLCAPTGKAARRLAESTGAEASTIHRLLEFVPGEGFGRSRDEPIPGADLLIVDEASMLDVRLAFALLDAVGPRTHVLLVGDVDQLAPVGPGRVLADLLEVPDVPATRLTEIFRQAERSLIIRAAHAINRGEPPPSEAGPDDLRDFFFIERAGARAIFDEVVSLADERLRRHYGVDEIQVLAPMHRGPAGIDALNDALRERRNPEGLPVAGTAFRVGDRAVQQRNDHERQIMNGESAVVVSAGEGDDGPEVVVRCDDGRTVRMPADALSTWKLGWCTSIHKSQGSQFPVVVVVLHTGHHVMLTRSLLYTAITRAEQACVVVGERQALATALRTLDAKRRYTRLAALVG